MPDTEMPAAITHWLRAQGLSDQGAVASLFSVLYDQLKRRAHFVLDSAGGQATLNTTGLVNETYLRLVEAGELKIQNRRHFLALAAKTMRWVVIDSARARMRQRRGGGANHVSLDEAMVMSEERAEELLLLDASLERLAVLDERLAAVVEYRFYGGLGVEETADALGVSTRTVKRDWRAAKAFLARSLTSSSGLQESE